MPKVTGRDTVKRFLLDLPATLERRVLPGAARAGGKVILEHARERANAEAIRDDLTVKVRRVDERIVVRVTVKPGWGRALGIWAEYGTSPHFISVDDRQRGGMTVRRINALGKETGDRPASLVIGGTFVGATGWHPGAQPQPFLHPAADTTRAEQVAAMRSYVKSRVRGGRILPDSDSEGDA